MFPVARVAAGVGQTCDRPATRSVPIAPGAVGVSPPRGHPQGRRMETPHSGLRRHPGGKPDGVDGSRDDAPPSVRLGNAHGHLAQDGKHERGNIGLRVTSARFCCISTLQRLNMSRSRLGQGHPWPVCVSFTPLTRPLRRQRPWAATCRGPCRRGLKFTFSPAAHPHLKGDWQDCLGSRL